MNRRLLFSSILVGLACSSVPALAATTGSPIRSAVQTHARAGHRKVHNNKHVHHKPQPVPSRLMIPKLGVNAHVESLAMTRPADTSAPYSWWDVAWWNQGPRPGASGTALVFGHLDSTTGIAVFWYLRNLVRGDRVAVAYPHNHNVYFKVTSSSSYWDNKVPALLHWLEKPRKAHLLALITCTGVFHHGPGYDRRYVVLAQQV